jgi:uncharacterized protein (DUF736 family)
MEKSKTSNRYSPEVRARAVRMVLEHQSSYETQAAAILAIDNKTKEDGPDFRIMLGMQEVGAAWKVKTHEAEPRDYLSATIDDPAFPEPLRGAIFEDNGKLSFVWRRKT